MEGYCQFTGPGIERPFHKPLPLIRLAGSKYLVRNPEPTVSPFFRSRELYQLEVKCSLVRLSFPPVSGWKVHVHVDPMERAKGGQHKPDKASRAAAAALGLETAGARLTPHPLFGRVDVVAEHPEHGTRLVEVEGEASKQREQRMYSALGQLLLSMKLGGTHVRFGLAVPDTPEWTRQLRKIPPEITKRLVLDLYLVGENGVTTVWAGETIPNWARG
jgi:hypothetical protein